MSSERLRRMALRYSCLAQAYAYRFHERAQVGEMSIKPDRDGQLFLHMHCHYQLGVRCEVRVSLAVLDRWKQEQSVAR